MEKQWEEKQGRQDRTRPTDPSVPGKPGEKQRKGMRVGWVVKFNGNIKTKGTKNPIKQRRTNTRRPYFGPGVASCKASCKCASQLGFSVSPQ